MLAHSVCSSAHTHHVAQGISRPLIRAWCRLLTILPVFSPLPSSLPPPFCSSPLPLPPSLLHSLLVSLSLFVLWCGVWGGGQVTMQLRLALPPASVSLVLDSLNHQTQLR